MGPIDFYRQLLPFLISLAAVAVLIRLRKCASRRPKTKVIWISCLTFFGIYGIILLETMALDIFYSLRYEAYDTNFNGLIEAEEKTAGFDEARNALINDTARKLAYITGFILAISIALTVLIIGFAKVSVKRKK